ncbi:prolyl-tRNA synthetase associated domain-containing protein [Paenibacillus sp. UMB4589-SE434]|uniref:prolyl-tRNA synthetase associated domain-containing protein n=1 Tax=Paenibacillus sp. UMB4589-SE434 TaxID=3046314 RepID=UPI00254CBAF6|nr:prolyl-tRNA synthetase associated domain-containing protein [Paenibacillus sp. UMB4589-SE434]MDK8179365.1 prolyl-tRNA synthetase associated domain-containing protein [Paenibacillus sp. UMB4589-SE434]
MNKTEILELLEQLSISYDIVEHPAAYTIEEMDRFAMPNANQVAKNLFVRDDKKRSYYLLTIQKDKTVNLKELRALLNSRPLSFASEDDLLNYLGLHKGAVTPLGVLNDTERKIEVIIDEDLLPLNNIGIHPNENTATIWISIEDLLRLIQRHGNTVRVAKI